MSKKRYNAAEYLSKIIGLEVSEVNKLYENVKKNHHRLDSCIGHVFTLVNPQDKWHRRYKCTVCGGVIDSFAYGWYTKGLEHGRRQAKR